MNYNRDENELVIIREGQKLQQIGPLLISIIGAYFLAQPCRVLEHIYTAEIYPGRQL